MLVTIPHYRIRTSCLHDFLIQITNRNTLIGPLSKTISPIHHPRRRPPSASTAHLSMNSAALACRTANCSCSSVTRSGQLLPYRMFSRIVVENSTGSCTRGGGGGQRSGQRSQRSRPGYIEVIRNLSREQTCFQICRVTSGFIRYTCDTSDPYPPPHPHKTSEGWK